MGGAMRGLVVCACVSAVALSAMILVACGLTEDVRVPDHVFPLSDGGMTLQFVKEPAPMAELTMQDLDGRSMSTSDWRGKVTLVNFWATWCAPCREEIPHLIQLQERYPDHLQVIGVSTDEGSTEKVEEFVREQGINYPIVMATPEIGRGFPGVFALPTSFIVDPEGRIVQTHVGLISPAVFEQETRYLTSLPTNVTVEIVEKDARPQLANAAKAFEIPGLFFDLEALSAKQKEQALQRLNEDTCVCGCALTLAQCRINDSTCEVSLPMAKKVVAEIAGAN